MDFKGLKIGQLIFQNTTDGYCCWSIPFYVVEKHDDYAIGYNSTAKITAWIDEDTIDIFSASSEYALVYPFHGETYEYVLNDYQAYQKIRNEKSQKEYSVIINKDTEEVNTFSYEDTWKKAICDNFDENIVLSGNPDVESLDDASWYQRMAELLDDLDCVYSMDDIRRLAYPEAEEDNQFFNDFQGCIKEYGKENLRKVFIRYFNDAINGIQYVEQGVNERIVEYLNIAYSDRFYRIKEIHGCTQSEYQNVIYDSNQISDETISRIEDYYFCNAYEISIEEDGKQLWGQVVPATDFIKAQSQGQLKEYVENVLGLEGEYKNYKLFYEESKRIVKTVTVRNEIKEEEQDKNQFNYKENYEQSEEDMER